MAIFTEGTSRVSLPDSWVGVADQKYVDDQVKIEATTRSEADTALQGNIDAEAGTRSQADTALQGNIDAEAGTRSQADTALQGKITAAEEAIQGVDNKFNNYTPTLNIPDIKVKAAGIADKVVDGATMEPSGATLATTTFSTTLGQLKTLPNGFDFHSIKPNEEKKAGEFLLNGQYLVNGPIPDSYYGRCIIDLTNKARPTIKIWVAVHDVMTFYYASYVYFEKKWTDWKKIATTDKLYLIKKVDALQTGIDFNTLKEAHPYYLFFAKSNSTNTPNTLREVSQGILEVLYDPTNHFYQMQRYTEIASHNSKEGLQYKTNNIYVRTVNLSKTWSDWVQVATVQPSPAQTAYSTFNYGIEGETK